MVGKMSFRMTAPNPGFFSFQFSSNGFLNMGIILQSLFRQKPPWSLEYQHNDSHWERFIIINISLSFSLHVSNAIFIKSVAIVHANTSMYVCMKHNYVCMYGVSVIPCKTLNFNIIIIGISTFPFPRIAEHFQKVSSWIFTVANICQGKYVWTRSKAPLENALL